MSCPSATLVVWTSAWLHGSAAADDVLDALQSWGEPHLVNSNDDGTAATLDLPGRGERPAPPALLLAALRRAGVTGGGIALPVPGDVRELGGRSPFADAAIKVGEAVVLASAGLGVVPVRSTIPDNGTEVRWTVYDLPASGPGEYIPLAEAEHKLAGAMRAAATALVELDVARHRPNVRAEIGELVAAQPRLPWPPGMPARAMRVLQRAAEVAAILRVASGDEPGAALSASAARARAEALRPLDDAVRMARRAAVNESVRVLSESANQH
ncbi:MAG: hypothetical protein ACRDQ5_03605 [Sciscionella sp.]